MADDLRDPYRRPPREVLIDRQIRDAMADGKFDNLPFQGERLPLEDDSAAGDHALGFRMLRNARMAPPWIEADKEFRARLAERDALLARSRGTGDLGRAWRRRELERIVAAANRAVAVLNHEAPTARQHRLPLDLDAELRALEAAEHRRRDP